MSKVPLSSCCYAVFNSDFTELDNGRSAVFHKCLDCGSNCGVKNIDVKYLISQIDTRYD